MRTLSPSAISTPAIRVSHRAVLLEVNDGRRPAEDLLDCRRGQSLEVRPPDGRLLGVIREGYEPVGDRGACGLDPRSQQELEERSDIARREPLTIDLRGREHREQIVLRSTEPVPPELHAVLDQFTNGAKRGVEASEFGIAERHCRP